MIISLDRYPTAVEYQVVSRALVVAYPKLLDDSDGGYVSIIKPIYSILAGKILEMKFIFIMLDMPSVISFDLENL